MRHREWIISRVSGLKVWRLQVEGLDSDYSASTHDAPNDSAAFIPSPA